ncbi:hypothetical protein BDW60DRAFT_176907 [Aspergillus nidulans var. acristatus]
MPLLRLCKKLAWVFVPWCRHDKKSDEDDYSNHNYFERPDYAPAYNERGNQRIRESHEIDSHDLYVPYIYSPPDSHGSIPIDLNACAILEFNTSPTTPIPERIFSYHTIVYDQARERKLYRRVLLDFNPKRNIDAISDAIQQDLDLTMEPYFGSKVEIPNGDVVMPLGIVDVTWQIYKGVRPYRTQFVVIKDSQFDMLLGRMTIKGYEFWKEDKDIRERLRFRR